MFFQDLPPPPVEQEVIVTAARTPLPKDEVSDAVAIIDADEVLALGEPQLAPLLRLLPSIALAQTGPTGTQAQVRIRGAEANHSLLFIDGIKANDPAAGNEARFELLSAALGDGIEVVRGPQSATWGADAIGGVVALRSGTASDHVFRGVFEAGSDDFARASGDIAVREKGISLRGTADVQGSGGIDSFGANGERDGYDQRTVRLALDAELTPRLGLSLSGFALDAHSEFDGFDPMTFQRADTLDETDNRLGAARVGLDFQGPLSLGFAVSHLASSNTNLLDDAELNRTDASRTSLSAQADKEMSIAGFDNLFTLAVDHESEDFQAEDVAFGGLTEQDRSRNRTGFIGAWRLDGGGFAFDLSLRHDAFDEFADATSLSAGLRVPIGDVALTVNYGEGIAQPSFYDLFGFFPGSFVGNPDLRAERSRGIDVGIGYVGDRLDGRITLFAQQLEDEIVDVFDPQTFLSTTRNGDGDSPRRGIEVETGWTFSPALRLSANYSFLDAEGPEEADGVRTLETRRPRHRGALLLDGQSGPWRYGSSLAIVGDRLDTDFDLFPAQTVTLDSYALLGARIAYRIDDRFELSLRGRNLLNASYQDVIGYDTPGRGVHAGIALTL